MIKACVGEGQLHNLLVTWFLAKKWLILNKIWSFEFESPILLHLVHWGLIMWRSWWYGVVMITSEHLSSNCFSGRYSIYYVAKWFREVFEDTYHEANSCKEQKFWTEDDQEVSVSKDQQLGEERSPKCGFPDNIHTSWIWRIEQWATCTRCELHLLRLLISFLKELTDICQYLCIDCLNFS